jgi:protein-tyrosine phosphatase
MIDYDEIIPERLWVGSFVSEDTIPELQHLGITAVISLQTDEDLIDYGVSPLRLAESYKDAGIEWRRVPIPDFDRGALAHRLPDAVTELSHALAGPGSRAYLHCTAGISRSPTTAAGFLILTECMPAQEAWDYITSRRACSPAFDVLCDYEALVRASEDP